MSSVLAVFVLFHLLAPAELCAPETGTGTAASNAKAGNGVLKDPILRLNFQDTIPFKNVEVESEGEIILENIIGCLPALFKDEILPELDDKNVKWYESCGGAVADIPLTGISLSKAQLREFMQTTYNGEDVHKLFDYDLFPKNGPIPSGARAVDTCFRFIDSTKTNELKYPCSF